MNRVTVIGFAVLVLNSCGTEEDARQESAEECCTCLVNVQCVRADEYAFCKDTLEEGGSLEVRGLRSLTCDSSECVRAGQCASAGSSAPSGSEGSTSNGSGPGALPDDGNTDEPSSGAGDYILTVHNAEYGGVDLDGANWDIFDAPDPFVSVRINGESIGTTSTVVDTFYPEWSDTFAFDAPAGTSLSFRFFDADDVSGDDYGGEHFVEDLADAIASGGRSESTPDTAVVNVTYSIRRR